MALSWKKTSTPQVSRRQEEIEKQKPVPADEMYVARVEDARKRRLSHILVNMSGEHARVIIENLIFFAKEAHKDIRLLSGRLNPERYGPMVQLIGEVLDSGLSVKVLTLCAEDELKGNAFYNAVARHANGLVCSLNEPIDSTTHFLLAGDSAYRVELDDTTKEAYACFNDEQGLTVPLLDRLFIEKWNQCTRGDQPNDGNRAVESG